MMRWGRVGAGHGSFGLRNVAGPGVLPLMLSLIDLVEELVWYDFEAEVFQALEEDDASHADVGPKKRCTFCEKSTQNGTRKEFRLAAYWCLYLTNQLVEHNEFLQCVCEHLGWDITNVDYDLVGYFCCEWRRALWNRTATSPKVFRRDGPEFFRQVSAYVRAYQAVATEQETGSGSKKCFAERLGVHIRRGLGGSSTA